MHSFYLMAMLGAVTSAKDLISSGDRRELVAGDEYEGFQNVVWITQDTPLCTDAECETQVGTFSAATSWEEKGAADKTLYYGLIMEFSLN